MASNIYQPNKKETFLSLINRVLGARARATAGKRTNRKYGGNCKGTQKKYSIKFNREYRDNKNSNNNDNNKKCENTFPTMTNSMKRAREHSIILWSTTMNANGIFVDKAKYFDVDDNGHVCLCTCIDCDHNDLMPINELDGSMTASTGWQSEWMTVWLSFQNE